MQAPSSNGASKDKPPSNNVFMIRHGARVDNENASWKPLPGHASDDPQLSTSGYESSQQLVEKFSNIPLDHIVCSPFVRCIQTVAPIAKSQNLPIKVEPGICEVLNGLTSNYPPDFKTAEQLSQDFCIDKTYIPVMHKNNLKREWSDGDAAKRSRRVSLKIREQLRGSILFCGHGASCLGMAQAFGGGGYVGYSSVSHFVSVNKKWTVKEFGNVSHLSKELQRQSLASAW